MAASALKEPEIKWDRCRGMNDSDPPSELPDDQCTNALNVTLPNGALGKKRVGSAAVTFAGAFSGFAQITMFVPAQDESAAEVHFIDRTPNGTFWKVAAGTTATAVSTADAITSGGDHAVYVQANGKLYVFYDSAVNRLHVYDPATSTSAIRRVGLAAPAAPTIANSAGGGTYPAVARYYRVQWITIVSGTVRVSSNLGTASAVFTPSGSKTAAVVTRPTAASESETHWVVWGSADGDLYYKLSGNIAIATSTYDDSAVVADYADNEAQPDEGAFTPPPSAKFGVWDGTHMLMLGVNETSAGTGMTPKSGRVYITPALDTTDSDDDERISNTDEVKGWIDLNRNGGGEDRGLVGPLDGQVLAGQSKGIYLLIQTGINTRPYKRIQLSPTLGMVSHHSSFVGEDEAGRPCIYWLDPKRGPYRYGYGGVQWLGADIQGIWATVNLDATTKTAWGLYHGEPGKRRAMWWIATSGANTPNLMIVFHVEHGRQTTNQGIRNGWVQWNGDYAARNCGAMLPTTIGATMSRALSAYAGTATNALLKGESAGATADGSTAYAAALVSRAFVLNPLHVKKTLSKAYLQAVAGSGVTITCVLTPDYGRLTPLTPTASLTATGSETRVLRQFVEARMAQMFTVQIGLGDVSAVANTWTLEKFRASVETTPEEVA